MGRKLSPEEVAALGLDKPDPRAQERQRLSDENDRKLKEMGGSQSWSSGEDLRDQMSESTKRWHEPIARGINALGPAFTDTFAFGLPGHILDVLPDKAAHYLGGTRAEREAARAGSTVGDVAGKTMGFGMGIAAGPEKLVSEGVEAALPAAKSVAGRLFRGGISGGAQGGISAGASKALEGGDIKETGKAALEAAPLSAAMGAGMTGLGELAGAGRELAGKVFNAFRNPKSALGGQADTLATLDDMKHRGAIEGDLKRKVNDPELDALPRGKKGYIKASQQARDKITTEGAAELKAARVEYGKKFDEITAEHADQPYSMERVQARIDALREENTVNGETGDELLAAALDKAQRMITKKSPEGVDPGMHASARQKESAAAVREASARESTVADMVKAKKLLDKRAEWGAASTPENRPYRLLAREFADQAKDIDKRLGPLNEKYQQVMQKLEDADDIMPFADNSASRKRAAGVIHRIDDDTVAGGLAQEELDRLASLDPRYAEALRPVREKKALESTRFGLPQMSKSPEKWGTSFVEQNLDAIRARILDPAAASMRHATPASGRRIPPGWIPGIEQAYAEFLANQERRQ